MTGHCRHVRRPQKHNHAESFSESCSLLDCAVLELHQRLIALGLWVLEGLMSYVAGLLLPCAVCPLQSAWSAGQLEPDSQHYVTVVIVQHCTGHESWSHVS